MGCKYSLIAFLVSSFFHLLCYRWDLTCNQNCWNAAALAAKSIQAITSISYLNLLDLFYHDFFFGRSPRSDSVRSSVKSIKIVPAFFTHTSWAASPRRLEFHCLSRKLCSEEHFLRKR